MKAAKQVKGPLRRWAGLTLNAGFAMTGFATVLLGCLLPTLSSLWHANDAHAGRILASQFAGSAAGALLPGADFRRSALYGYSLLVIVTAAIAFIGFFYPPTFPVQCLLFFSLGLGLGWAMTSTSLLVGTLFRSSRGSALSFLNASWTIGAAFCPFAATQWASEFSVTSIFLPLCGFSLLVCCLLVATTEENGKQSRPASPIRSKIAWPLITFAMLAFLYVGVESSISGWMITFVHRDALTLSRFWAPLAASVFWVAVLCGRLMAPALLLVLPESRLFSGGIFVALAGLALLIGSHAPPLIVTCAFISGFALGPVFPLCISMYLELSGESPRTRYIFALSGFGGAVLPWITGVASTAVHSLRQALGVPLLALCVMAFLTLFSVRYEFSSRVASPIE